MIKLLDKTIFKWLVHWLYPQYYRPDGGYKANGQILRRYAIWQKIFRINGKVEWPVHFTTMVMGAERIKKGFMCDPGDSPGCYIQAYAGINFGSNVEIAPGCKIISQNHDVNDFSKALKSSPITIGDNVWIGANVVILPGVNIGHNVVIGAGSIVTKDIPDNSIAVGNPCKVIKQKPAYQKDIYKIKLNRKFTA